MVKIHKTQGISMVTLFGEEQGRKHDNEKISKEINSNLDK